MTKQHGVQAICKAFLSAKTSRSTALMPYFTLGYPTFEGSLKIIAAIAPHADLLELGVPFSDPIADGPTIQRSTQQALDHGVDSAMCLQGVRELRAAGIDTPILLMGYYNPILAYGERRYVHDAADAGVDGFIVPDLPPEEGGPLRATAAERALAVINFLAPTSNQRRIKLAVDTATGFIYMVSVTGVTGARKNMQLDLAQIVDEIRIQCDLPVAVGFGISTPGQAANVANFADGVIVGSALIDAVDQSNDKPAAAAQYIGSLAQALKRDSPGR